MGTGEHNKSGITVHHEIVVHTNQHTNGKAPSMISMIQSTSNMRPRSPQPPLRLGRLHRKPSDSDELQRDLLEKRNDDSMRYLVDFLKNAPPPEKSKPAPESCSSSMLETSRWTKKFNIFRGKWRKENRKSTPPAIRLPDSAVAARTTGGHRHISISIPYQFSHLGPDSPSQYPVYEPAGKDFERELDTRLGIETKVKPLPSYTSDRGVVTVLKPVAEDHESLMSEPTALRSPASPERRDSAQALSPTGGGLTSFLGATNKQPELPQEKEVKDAEVQAATTITPKTVVILPKAPLASSQSAENNKSVGSSARPGPDFSESRLFKKRHSRSTSVISNSSILSINTTVTSWAVPERRSSKKAKDSVEISDFCIRTSSNYDGEGGRNSFNDRRRARGSFAESVATLDSEFRVLDAQSAKAYTTIPIVVQPQPRPIADSHSPLNLDFPLPPSNNADLSAESDVPAPPDIQKTQTRKERVREKKRRDLEAEKARALEGLELSATGSSPDPENDCVSSISPVLENFGDAGSALSPGPPPEPTNKKVDFAPITVEVDDELSESLPKAIRKTSACSSKSPAPSAASATLSSDDGPSVLYLDRNSGEWRKECPAEDKACDPAEAVADRDESKDRLPQEEVVARYGSLMKARFDNMEKGIEHLERSAETWLRSIVPVMENLDRSIQEQYQYQKDENAWYIMGPASSSAPRGLRTRSAEPPESIARFRAGNAAVKARPHSAGAEVPHRRRHSWREITPTHRPSVLSPLPRRIEDKMRMGRATEDVGTHLDATVRRASAETIHDRSSSERTSIADLEFMEPLMKGLQGTARFSMEEEDEAIVASPAATGGMAENTPA